MPGRGIVPIGLIAVLGWPATGSGADRVVIRLVDAKGHMGALDFSQKTAKEDEEFWSKHDFGRPTNRREDQVQVEKETYEGTGYTPLADNTVVHGYNIGKNQ